MAFPIVRSVSTYSTTTAATSHNVSAPGTTVAGDTLLLFVEGIGGLPTATGSWTLVATNNDTTNSCYFRIYKKPFETGANGATVTFSSARRMVAQIYAVSTTDHVQATLSTTYSAADCPSLTLTGAGTENLFIAVDGTISANSPTGAPSGYSGYTATASSTNGERVSTAYKTSSSATEDPGVFATASSSFRNSATVGVFLTPPLVPTIGSITVAGQTPIVNAFTGRPNQATLALSGMVPAQFCSFVGRGYKAELQAILEPTRYATFVGRGYEVIPEMLGGFIFLGRGYAVAPNLSLTPDYNSVFTGYGYSARLEATLGAIIPIRFDGRGYTVTPEMLGGFILSGSGYSALLSSSLTTSERASFLGRGFRADLDADAIAIESIAFIGRGYKASLYQEGFIGRGYTVAPLFSFAPDTTYAEAFIMNLVSVASGNTSNFAVSRYQNFPFYHLAKIGSTYYGIRADGLYELTGEYDGSEDILVNGTIHTHTTDYRIFNSKNVPYVYLNGDDDYSVTAFVDDVEQPAFTSGFGGRRVKLARGNKGRYWEFKIEGIKKLQGIEHLPDGLSRRVK